MINNFTFFLGLPGCGKSTHLRSIPSCYNLVEKYYTRYGSSFSLTAFYDFAYPLLSNAPDNTYVISADEIKEGLKGFSNEHPESVHEASVQMARKIICDLAENKTFSANVLLDGGGINNHYNLEIIEFLRNHNVKNIKCVYFDTPIDVCLKRIEQRTRKVPVEEIFKKNLRLEVCKNRYIPLVDEFEKISYYTNKYLLLDMDGTLACYGKAKYDIHGNSDFVSSELFKNLKPVQHVIDYVKEHFDMANVYIITACANSIAWKEKNEWLDRYFPEIPIENRLFVGNKNYKHVFIEQFADMKKWKRNEVTLIDDFHETLAKCDEIGINAVHPSNITALFDKYSSLS
jgi:5'(3')-deoxyribonucleotidase/predicted kinase